MRTFGHQRPVRDPATKKIIDHVDSPVTAITREALGGAFGKDKRQRLVVTLGAGDVVHMRPTRTGRTVSGTAQDIYRYLLTNAANAAVRRAKEYAKTMTRKQANRKARKEFGLV